MQERRGKPRPSRFDIFKGKYFPELVRQPQTVDDLQVRSAKSLSRRVGIQIHKII